PAYPTRRSAALLAGAQRFVQVDDLLRIHTDAPPVVNFHQIAGAGPIEPVAPATADRVDLDSRAHALAVRRYAVVVVRAELRLDQLHLKRNAEPVLFPPDPKANENLSRLHPLAHGQRLQAVPIEQPVGIGLVGPSEPEPVNLLAQRIVLHLRLRLDAGPDDVGDQPIDCALGVPVIPGS